ncbi:MAG TPA: magnesium/cobalt transporter CorA [Thermoleophilaceae bacterium]|nr:magnesium/cobalt transporter CorA [Thermoleophilaceae bacterium]
MIVDCAVYEAGTRADIALAGAQEACLREDAFVWIGLHEPTPEEFDAVSSEFDLHELAVEDAIKAHQRPKLERYDDVGFLVLKTAWYVEPDSIEFGEILLFVGASFVISVRHGAGVPLGGVRAKAESRADLLRCGPMAVVHAILDEVVDAYAPVIEALDRDIEEVEREVFSDERGNPAQRIYELKRETIEFARAVTPLVEPVERMLSGRTRVPEALETYFRDVLDHLIRLSQHVEASREVLTSVLQANLAQVGVRQNEDMRKISAWVAIVAVPTMIAGIYGMNFDHMPELEWELGYPGVLASMALICFGLWRYFKRVGWL